MQATIRVSFTIHRAGKLWDLQRVPKVGTDCINKKLSMCSAGAIGGFGVFCLWSGQGWLAREGWGGRGGEAGHVSPELHDYTFFVVAIPRFAAMAPKLSIAEKCQRTRRAALVLRGSCEVQALEKESARLEPDA